MMRWLAYSMILQAAAWDRTENVQGIFFFHSSHVIIALH